MSHSAVADMVGRVLASRYRLLAPVGAGGSGRVFVADDVRLRRRVAVKVLHSALADDAGFLRRFRAEAQLAASLHHPHVMAVYDWGEDVGMPFMVVELLKGGSLRGMLDNGARLSPSQAAHVGRQVAAALRYAHMRGLVHRDIKPGNLLFDEHGLVRVADFGLARALAEASWTEPAGEVLGTARYAAPEQASGAPLDGRADLYALAVVLVEACTGEVPIVADTAIGTLAARGSRAIVAPPEMGRLGAIVERAGRPEPADRYPDAATMGAALADAVRELPAPESLHLAGLGEAGEDLDPTRVGRRSGAAGVFDQDRAPSDSTNTDEVLPLAIMSDEPRRFRRSAIPFVVGIAIVTAIVVGLVALAGALGGGATIAVPRLVGQDQQAAAASATRAGLLMKVVERRTADDPAGYVIEQRPGPGDFLEDGAEIEVVVSRGPPPVAVPDVVGKPAADAQAALEQASFVVAVERRFDDKIPRDAAIGTRPGGGERAPRESKITLVVSDGPTPTPVPGVAGKSYEEAAGILQNQGFEVTRRDDFSDTVDVGLVIGTEPAEGKSAQRGSQVTIIVSKGPDLVEVPRVRGMSVEEASQALTAAGLVPDVRNYAPGGRVRAQDPDAGQKLKRGSTVTLFL